MSEGQIPDGASIGTLVRFNTDSLNSFSDWRRIRAEAHGNMWLFQGFEYGQGEKKIRLKSLATGKEVVARNRDFVISMCSNP